MTSMGQTHAIFLLPRRADEVAIKNHQATVFNALGDVFIAIEDAMREALPKAKATFALHEVQVDLAVHAPWTRLLTKDSLLRAKKDVEVEDELDFDLLRVSNCGLCIRTEYGHVRILKAPNGEGVPKAQSAERIQFVIDNQLCFVFADESRSVPKLNLFVLWKMNKDLEFLGLDIACPRQIKNKDTGEIECHWIASWNRSLLRIVPSKEISSDLDLTEIAALPVDDEQVNKG